MVQRYASPIEIVAVAQLIHVLSEVAADVRADVLRLCRETAIAIIGARYLGVAVVGGADVSKRVISEDRRIGRDRQTKVPTGAAVDRIQFT